MRLDEYFAENGRAVTKATGEHLFRQGEHTKLIYFVNSGLLKAYYLSADGREHVKSFILPGDNIGSLMSVHAKKPSTFSLVCLKPCNLTVVEFDALYRASQSDIELAAAVVNFLLGFGIKKEVREFELLCLSAEERYRRLVEKTPDLLELVTQNEIARYLGITPVGLSRIKKRLSN
ncbi:MAG: Crp/Fnr family transcriptional regulator [Pseudomonadota bacterium]